MLSRATPRSSTQSTLFMPVDKAQVMSTRSAKYITLIRDMLLFSFQIKKHCIDALKCLVCYKNGLARHDH